MSTRGKEGHTSSCVDQSPAMLLVMVGTYSKAIRHLMDANYRFGWTGSFRGVSPHFHRIKTLSFSATSHYSYSNTMISPKLCETSLFFVVKDTNTFTQCVVLKADSKKHTNKSHTTLFFKQVTAATKNRN